MISQNVAVLSWLVMLVVGLIDIQYMQSVIKGFFFFFFFFFFSKIATILVIWKPCLQRLSEGGKPQYWRKKSQLCFRANATYIVMIVTQITVFFLFSHPNNMISNSFFSIYMTNIYDTVKWQKQHSKKFPNYA